MSPDRISRTSRPSKLRAAERLARSTRELLRHRGPTRKQHSRRQRERQRRRAILFGGIGIIALIALVLGFGYLRENVLRGQETVAVVYGSPITTGDLLQETRPRLARLDQQIAFFRDQGLTQQLPQMQFQREQLPETVLRDMTEDRVARREAMTRGIIVTADETTAELHKIIATEDYYSRPQPSSTPLPTVAAGSEPTPTAAGTPTRVPTTTPLPTLTEDRYSPVLQEYLLRSRQDEGMVRRTIESELIEQKLRTAIGEEVPERQEMVQIRQMGLRTEEEANAALAQLQSGRPFEAVAAAITREQPPREGGAEPTWLVRGGLDADLETAAFGLQPGQISGVVKIRTGWAIVQAVERSADRAVDANMLENLRRRHYSDWLMGATSGQDVERKLGPEQSKWIMQRAARRSTP